MKKIKIILRVIIFIIIGISIFYILTNILVPKTAYSSILREFYNEPENSLDVIFIGDSSIYKGISPLEIWKKYGITSYNYASPSQKMWDSYYCIEEVIKYQNPKIIVLNIDQMYNAKPMNEGYKRHLYDNMQLSETKIKAITDAVQQNEKEDTISYMLPLLRFHDRWSKLTDDDFKYALNQKYHDKNIFKGYYVVKKAKPYKKKENKLASKIEPKAEAYLKKIKKLCQENQIELLLIEAPTPKIWNLAKHEKAREWAQKNNIPFLDTNMALDEIGIDWEKDTEDGGAHLNIKGAKKLSEYIGNYLVNHYEFNEHKNDEIYKQWNEELKIYEEYIKKQSK